MNLIEKYRDLVNSKKILKNKKLPALLILPPLLTLFTLLLLYYYYIIKNPGSHIRRENIMKQISVESPVFYNNEKDIMGVFFNREHRRYLKVRKDNVQSADEDYIPKNFINALISTEDSTFYSHIGVNLKSILRAAIANIKAGRIVQGGSTITQQTAKNIFRRKHKTFRAKFTELINALRLEYHYTKDEILEFYTNQFYVNGNGRGLGVAALYFFNKKAKDLSLTETAFIVASLKGPDGYNPFIKRGEKTKKKAYDKSMKRVSYILDRMYELKKIKKDKYKEAKLAKLVFNQGAFRFANNVIMDYIRKKLESSDFSKLLLSYGITNLATSGVRVFTTIDPDIQKGLFYSLRSHLSYINTILYGYIGLNEKTAKFKYLNTLEEKEFYAGKITDTVYKTNKSYFKVNFGDVNGIVDYKALLRFSGRLKSYKKGYYATGGLSDVKSLFKKFKKGDYLYVSVKRKIINPDQFLLDIEDRPLVNGGGIVLENGEVRALSGGFSNLNYNRALYAKREPGSVFKPLLYMAALTLNWNNLDELLNIRNVFTFQNQFYFPNPDHTPKSDTVSMTFAGANSENIASVYLLDNLTNKLNKEQFFKIASLVGLTMEGKEKYNDYVNRIRDKDGIVSLDINLRRGIFYLSKDQFISELKFLMEDEQIFNLKSLNYGVGFNKQKEKIMKKKRQTEFDNIKLNILDKNFIRLSNTNDELKRRLKQLKPYFDKNFKRLKKLSKKNIVSLLNGFYKDRKKTGKGKLFFYVSRPRDNNFIPFTIKDLYKLNSFKREATFNNENIIVENLLMSRMIDDIKAVIDEKFNNLKGVLPYDKEKLYYNKDFRTLVGLQYLVKMMQKLGTTSKLASVLSFPLGSNSISLYESALAYQTMLSGKIYNFSNGNKQNELTIIKRIEDYDGQVIYDYKPLSISVVDESLAHINATILREAVKFGTGRRANKKVKVSGSLDESNELFSYSFPVFGKTGTTNDYTNATFVGFLPQLKEKGVELSLKNALTIAVYVGRDDNKYMKNKRIKIAGASGALPVWIGTANHIIESKKYSKNLDFAEMAFRYDNKIPVLPPKGSINVDVDKITGLLEFNLSDKTKTIKLYTLAKKTDSGVFLNRYFKPFNLQ